MSERADQDATAEEPIDFELASRDVTSGVTHRSAGRPQRAHFLYPTGLRMAANLFAGVLGVLLVASILVTIWRSLRVPGSDGFGLEHYLGVLADPAMRDALARSGLWAVVAIGVTLLGLAIAALGRLVGTSSRLLTLSLLIPLAASMLVTGAAFRLLIDPDPERGTLSALTTGVYEMFDDPAPAPGARPDETLPDPARLHDQGDLATTFGHRVGCQVDLRVVTLRSAGGSVEGPVGSPSSVPPAVDQPAGGFSPISCPEPGQPRSGLITGSLVDQWGPLPGVPILADASGVEPVDTVTDERGRFVLRPRPAADSEAEFIDYRLIIPEYAITPSWPGPQPYRAEVVWIPLVLAFTWAWLGFAVSLFRARLDAIPPDAVRVAKAEGLTRIRRMTRLILPLLRPVIFVVMLTLIVAAVRLFDLVLVLVPGPLQAEVDVGAVLWWRSAEATQGERAAMATLLFGMVALVALGAVWGVRRSRGVTSVLLPLVPRGDHRRSGRPRRGGTLLRGSVTLALGVIGAVWLLPIVVLIGTALRSPADAALHGWWSSGTAGLGLESVREMLEGGLLGALGASLFMAGTTALLVAVIAGSVAHSLAWGAAGPRRATAIVVVLALLAVAPVQLYAAPMSEWFGSSNLTGTNLNLALILAHTAAGLPFAILLMRGAFLTAPSGSVRTSTGEADRRTEAFGLIRRHWDAVVAVAVLEFVLVWNDLVMGLLLGGTLASPLTVLLWGESRWFHTSAGPLAAGAVLSLIVPLCVLILGWRTAVRGLAGVRRDAV